MCENLKKKKHYYLPADSAPRVKGLRPNESGGWVEILPIRLKPIISVWPVSEEEAVKYALENAIDGSFITVCSDVIPDALEVVKSYKEKEDMALA